ncbi:uncharacterized protein LOC144637579 [Oculina patagonica]
MSNTDAVIQAISIGLIVASFLLYSCRVQKAIELCKECLFLLKNQVVKEENITKLFYKVVYSKLLQAYCLMTDYTNATKYAKKLIHIHRECGERHKECWLSIGLATMYLSGRKYTEAKDLCEQALLICTAICDKNGEAYCYGILGKVYQSVGEYEKAREYHEKALALLKETGTKTDEASSCISLGAVYQAVGEYEKARLYLEEALAINKEIGDRNGEASCYGNLGVVFRSVGDYKKARKYHEKALAINKETGDKNGEASSYANLGIVFQSVGEYEKAKEYLEEALSIAKENGNREAEGLAYGNLGNVFRFNAEYVKAKEYLGKALVISKEIGNKDLEASSWANLGVVSHIFGEYKKAIEYHEKALAINKGIGDKNLEVSSYGNLGAVFQSLRDYEKAKEYHEKALVKQIEMRDKSGEASSLGNIGILLESVGELENARENYQKALTINKEIGDRNGEAACYENLGTLFQSLGKYPKTNECLQRALLIRQEIGDRRGEASTYGNLGVLFLSLGDYDKAKEYHEKALAIRKDICDRKGEALDYLNLGTVFQIFGEYSKAEEFLQKGLSISEETGQVEKQFCLLCKVAWVKVLEGKVQEALSYLLSGIQKYEDLIGFLRDNDQFKISLTDKYVSCYWLLSSLFCAAGNPKEALYVSELGRARALADLMPAKYSVEGHISANPQTWVGLERIMDQECQSSTCLYVSYSCDNLFLWILKASGVVHCRRSKCQGDVMNIKSGLVRNLDDFFVNEIFRCFCILNEENCEDRSLNGFHCKPKSCQEDSHEASRIGKDDKDNLGPKVNLSLCYKLIIAPVLDLLDGPEIIIVPDRSLYNIPFAALPDENGNYLSETFRIRVVPSLTTLKLIHDSPADYHSQTGALIVGNPDVGEVHFKGRLTYISRLPCAENEAKMVGEKLGVKPLIGQQATKQAVLEVINSASLVHFAAHGDAERGEIALAPALRIPNIIPQEEHYLLTMSDISKVQLRAKLVVLSCCHSARGQIGAEGAVGLARAFLGSGARSVLVALWALEDSATEQFMSHFYEHLVCGESASESLHEAMKWMRCNGYSDVRQWAPFMLIGDNVTFDFGKLTQVS